MAKHKRSHKSKKVPLAVAVPVLITTVDIGKAVISGDTASARLQMTGIDSNGKFYFPAVAQTYGPILAGALIHMGASKLGVNRAIAKVPFISI
jgi:hypothetical protein